MNWRGGRELIRRSMFGWMAGRGFFWSLAFGWMMPSLVYLFVWLRVANEQNIAAFSRDEFVVYYLAFIVVNQFTYPVANWTVGDVIRNGTFSNWLMRPMPPVFEPIASDIAMKMVTTPFAVGITAVLAIILRPSFSITVASLLYFLLALVLAQILRFMAAYVLSLLALWFSRADALLMLNDTLIFLLAGQVAPIALLPGAIQQMAIILPYRYMISFPLELLLGKLSAAEIAAGFTWQIGWVLLVLLLHQWVWRRGIRHYSAVGG